MTDMDEAFKKLFGDMYLAESKTAMQIFEYGYKAGAAAENESCAKACEVEASVIVTNASEQYQEGRAMGATVCAAAIRARGE
jgi:hypothetical protein